MCNCNAGVTIHTQMVAMATIDMPEESKQWATCNECGEVMDISDIAEGEEVEEEPSYKFRMASGYPSEFYD